MNQSVTKRMNRVPAWLKGTAISLLISTAFIFILPVFVLNGMIETDYIKYIFYLIQSVAIFLGIYMGQRTIDKNILLGSVLVEVIYLVFIISISVIFFDGISRGIWGSVISCSIGMFAAVLARTRSQGSAKRKRRRTI